jgi:hypothetical protein
MDSDDDDLASCLQLAREKMTELAEPAKKMAEQNLSLLQERLNAAEQMLNSDPDKAEDIYRGIIALYHNETWAEPAVARAREALR